MAELTNVDDFVGQGLEKTQSIIQKQLEERRDKLIAEDADRRQALNAKAGQAIGSLTNVDNLSDADWQVILGQQAAAVPQNQAPQQPFFNDVQTQYKDIPGIKGFAKESADLDKKAIDDTEKLQKIQDDELKNLAAQKEVANNQLEMENKILEAETAKQAALEKAKLDFNNYDSKIKEFKLDPNRLMNANAMNKVWSSIAVGLAFGISNNAGTAMINSIDQMIERDIAQQEAELLKLKEGKKYAENAVTVAFKTFGDTVDSMSLAKATIYQNIADRLELESIKNGSKNKINNDLLITSLKQKAVENKTAYAEKQAKVLTSKLIPLDTSAMNDKKFDKETQLRNEILTKYPKLQEYMTQAEASKQLNAIDADKASGIDQVSIVYEFVRSLDPKSVVRESEVELAGTKGMSILEYGNMLTQMITNKGYVLTPNLIRQMQAVARRRTAISYTANILPIYKMYGPMLKGMPELNPANVFPQVEMPAEVKKGK